MAILSIVGHSLHLVGIFEPSFDGQLIGTSLAPTRIRDLKTDVGERHEQQTTPGIASRSLNTQ
jgi:hypothetical protein